MIGERKTRLRALGGESELLNVIVELLEIASASVRRQTVGKI